MRKFRVGDKVRVCAQPPENSCNSTSNRDKPYWFAESMDRLCGRVGEVFQVNPVVRTLSDSYHVLIDGERELMDGSWLEAVDPYSDPTEEQAIRGRLHSLLSVWTDDPDKVVDETLEVLERHSKRPRLSPTLGILRRWRENPDSAPDLILEVQALQAAGNLEVNLCDEGYTFLKLACTAYRCTVHPTWVKWLLQQGADPNLLTPLATAISSGGLDSRAYQCCLLLLAAGAKVNVPSTDFRDYDSTPFELLFEHYSGHKSPIHCQYFCHLLQLFLATSPDHALPLSIRYGQGYGSGHRISPFDALCLHHSPHNFPAHLYLFRLGVDPYKTQSHLGPQQVTAIEELLCFHIRLLCQAFSPLLSSHQFVELLLSEPRLMAYFQQQVLLHGQLVLSIPLDSDFREHAFLLAVMQLFPDGALNDRHHCNYQTCCAHGNRRPNSGLIKAKSLSAYFPVLGRDSP